MENPLSMATTRRCLIDALPNEVWTTIIQQCITRQAAKFQYMMIDRLLPLTLVSQVWSERILATSTLWTDIVLSDEVDEQETKIITALYLSKAAFISLYFIKRASWSTLSTYIIAERSRISSIWMETDTVIRGVRDPPSNWRDTLLGELSPLPELCKIWCRRPLRVELDLEFFKAHLKLTDIDGFFLPDTEIDRIASRLRTFCAWVNPANIFALIQTARWLKTVGFSTVDPNTYSTDRLPADNRLLNWESLTSSLWDNRFNTNLLNRLQHTLVYLDIVLYVDNLMVRFLHSLGQLDRLHECCIRMKSPTNMKGIVVDHSVFSSACEARNLTLAFDTIYRIDEGVLKMLGAALQAVMPNITKLTIGARSPEQIFSILHGEGFSKITKLSISQHSVTSRLYDKSFARSFSSLASVTTNIRLEMLNFLLSSPIQNIKLRETVNSGRVQMGHFNGWSELHSLELRVSRPLLPIENFSPKELRKLVFLNVYDSTALCHYLAQYPHSCPKLEDLEFHAIPEWDIFFIMLERRNLFKYPVSPLRFIRIPGRCPRYLLVPIRQLLRRVSPLRPSYYELSSHTAQKALHDPNITGCVKCIQAHRFCAEPVNIRQFTVSNPPVILDLAEYPEDPEEILSNWQAPTRSNSRGRQYACSAWPASIMTITEDSTEDSTCEWNEDQVLQFLYDDNLVGPEVR